MPPASDPPPVPRLRARCVGCGRTVAAGLEHAGKTAKCPGCGGSVTLPAGAAEPPPLPASTPSPAPSRIAPAAPLLMGLIGVVGLAVGYGAAMATGGSGQPDATAAAALAAERAEVRGEAASLRKELATVKGERDDYLSRLTLAVEVAKRIEGGFEKGTHWGAAREFHHLMATAQLNQRMRVAALRPVEAVCVGSAAVRVGMGYGGPFDVALLEQLVGPTWLTKQHRDGLIVAVDDSVLEEVDSDRKIRDWPEVVEPIVRESGSDRLRDLFAGRKSVTAEP